MLRWCRTRWQPLSCLLLGRCTSLLKDSTETIAQHFTVWGRHASWGILRADINSFCVQLTKSVSEGFCVLMFKVLKWRKVRISILSTLFAFLFLYWEVKMKRYTRTTQEEFFKWDYKNLRCLYFVNQKLRFKGLNYLLRIYNILDKSWKWDVQSDL